MDRPHESHEKRSVDAARRIAQRHAQRAAVLARREAAARRRLALVSVLLVVTVAAWAAVGFGALLAGIAVAPSVLLVATLGLGRAAVVSGQRNDAAWAREQAALEHDARAVARRAPRAASTGRAVRASEDETLVIERVTDDAAPVAPVAASDEDAWQPVPVPRPTYTLKSPAPRWEPAPLEVPERVVEEPAAGAGTDGGQAGAPAARSAAVVAAEQQSVELDLDAILARRRAAGA